MPDDYTKNTYTDWFVQYDFKIYIEPCLVNTYVSTLDAGPITYRVGDPTLTDGPYIFTEDPVCNYPETVTLTDLPYWAQHNLGDSDFTIPSTGDLTIIGEHIVTIKGEILVPTDYTSTTLTPMTVEYPFSIFVEPCVITDFTTVPIDKVVYTIGSPPVISQTYSFTQVPACNYDVTLTVTDLPVFATHQAPTSQDFLVP